MSFFGYSCSECGVETNHPIQFVGLLWCGECYSKEPDKFGRTCKHVGENMIGANKRRDSNE